MSQAGLGVLTSFLNALDFWRLCEDRFSQFVPSTAVHRPGKMIADLAIMLAAGGEQVTVVDQLSSSPGLFGPVASEATISRMMDRLKDKPAVFECAFVTMLRTLRSRVWAAAGNRNPATRATTKDPLTIDIKATLVHVHSDKEKLWGPISAVSGSPPMIASIDYGKENGSGEVLAVQMRPGNKGASSAADNITILDQALAQLPDEFYTEDGVLVGEKILVRTDSAGASHDFLHHLESLGLQFSTSYALPVINERFIGWINDKASIRSGAHRNSWGIQYGVYF